MANIKGIALPPITSEFLERVKQAFRPNEVTPKTEINQIMYEAGAQAVISYLEQHARPGTKVLGDPEELERKTVEMNTRHKSWWRRMFGWW